MDGRAAGADRFVALVRHGYYDQARSLRTRPGFWTQFGINSTPEIAKAWRTVREVDRLETISALLKRRVLRGQEWAQNRGVILRANLVVQNAVVDRDEPTFT